MMRNELAVANECPNLTPVFLIPGSPNGDAISNKRELSAYAESNPLPCLVASFDFLPTGVRGSWLPGCNFRAFICYRELILLHII